MHAVIRTYSGKGAKELGAVLKKRKKAVETVMRSVKGFTSYSLIDTGDGVITVTVCKTKKGTDESVQKARDWVAKNAAETGAAAPQVSEGAVVLQLS